eukprot:1120462-Amphidinium_carterae.1
MLPESGFQVMSAVTDFRIYASVFKGTLPPEGGSGERAPNNEDCEQIGRVRKSFCRNAFERGLARLNMLLAQDNGFEGSPSAARGEVFYSSNTQCLQSALNFDITLDIRAACSLQHMGRSS